MAESTGHKYRSREGRKTQLRQLASDMGIDRVELQEIDADALLVERRDGQFTLFLNKEQPKVRHRFSVAHELAHLLLTPSIGHRAVHRRRFTHDQDPEGKRIEALCNAMASSILMPSQRVRELINPGKLTAACVPVIAKEFDVSFEAAGRRFVNVATEPWAIIFWQPDGNSRANILKPPVCNETLGAYWPELRPSTPGLPITASKAIATDEMVVSDESVLISPRWATDQQRPRYISDVKVESFGRGRTRHIVSFAQIPFQKAHQKGERQSGLRNAVSSSG